ncbi:hypothetical protein ACGFSI_34975 [Streptomyces virginiae]|uniref:hypothetical protein n=1 Tax=Streptomyces virginiae TaxID=1961 RepID=UPI003715CC19
MSTIKRAAVAAVTVAAPAAPTASAAPAYKCAGSTKDIDDVSYDGPRPDNWKVTVRTCAARSGGIVYAYAEVRWDGAGFHRAGAAALGDSVLFLDWHGDGRGYPRHDYTAFPTV